MDLFSYIFGFGETVFVKVVPFLFVLTVVVFFHELGHFLVARWCGVKVSTFSIGFGPEIYAFDDSKGTRWRIAWIPLGGYVKFIDDENAASVPDSDKFEAMSEKEREGSFQSKSLLQRAAVVAAGPIANFLLAIAIFAFMFTFIGERQTAARIDSLVENGAAAKAGFKTGDLIVEIDGRKIDNFGEMQRIVSVSGGTELDFAVERDTDLVRLKATPERKEITDRFGNKIRMGILGIRRNTTPENVILKKHDILTATWMGVKECYFVIDRTLSYLYDVIVGRESADQLGGPLRIAQVSSQVASIGFVALLNLVAILSVSIGLLNLFPIPMLDGGHLLFYAFEAVRGKPVSEQAREIGFRIGLAFVLFLMIFATWNDLVHLTAN